jgi:hypothetical protein
MNFVSVSMWLLVCLVWLMFSKNRNKYNNKHRCCKGVK